MPSQTKENYLKTIFSLAQQEEVVGLSDLSKVLGVSIPTVNSMVKKLQEKGWVVYKKYKPLELTTVGRRVAALIIRKHRLAEMFLVEAMGFGWEEVHDIAEEMEHIDSIAFFERMDEMLGFPTIDPHGSPIPDKEGNIAFKEYSTLAEVQAGKKVRLCALTRSSTAFLLFLNGKNLELGTIIDVKHVEPFDKSILVDYTEHKDVMLSREVCERLLVEEV